MKTILRNVQDKQTARKINGFREAALYRVTRGSLLYFCTLEQMLQKRDKENNSIQNNSTKSKTHGSKF